jgi:hypothetical protein
MTDFFHSGDLGDVISALSTVRAMGGGRLYLRDEYGVETMHGMTRERFDAIAPLLREQPYITDVQWAYPPGDCVNLNRFRRMNRDLCNEWLPNHYLDVNGIDRSAALSPWLNAPATQFGGVLIARSARYHNDRFPWKRVLEQYPGAEFVGTWNEYTAFKESVGAIRYLPTPDLQDLAYVIAGCDLFIGNQSCPLWIAEGLKKPIVCEVCPICPNCISPRPDFFAGWDANVELPHAVPEPSAA